MANVSVYNMEGKEVYNAVSDLFAGGNSDSRVLPSRIHHVHDQIFVCVGLPSPVNRLEILIFL